MKFKKIQVVQRKLRLHYFLCPAKLFKIANFSFVQNFHYPSV